jgi:hypothetical protein
MWSSSSSMTRGRPVTFEQALWQEINDLLPPLPETPPKWSHARLALSASGDRVWITWKIGRRTHGSCGLEHMLDVELPGDDWPEDCDGATL